MKLVLVLVALAACSGDSHKTNPDAGVDAPPDSPSLNVARVVRVTRVGDGRIVSTPAGIDCPGQCAAEFPDGSTVSLAVTASEGATFEGWTGPCRGQTTCALQLSGNDVALSVGFSGLGNLWANGFFGAGDNVPHGMAVDSSGTILVAGEFGGAASFGATQLTSAGGQDAFVVGYAPDGTIRFALAFGGSGDDRAWAVAASLDNSPGFAVAGEFRGTMTIGTTTLVSNGGADAFVAEFLPDGTPVWARSFGGTSDDVARGVAMTPSPATTAAVTVTGAFSGSADFGTGAIGAVGVSDVFVARYSSADGTPAWAHTFGAAGATDVGYAVTHDNADDAIVAGAFTGSIDFGGGAQASAGGSDGFVAALDSTGAYVWARRFGGAGDDAAFGVADSAPATGVAISVPEIVAVTGTFTGSSDFGTGAVTSAGGADGFVAAYQPDGTPLWSHDLGGAGSDAGLAVAIDRSGAPSVAGVFSQTIALGASTYTSAGGNDGFVAKLDAGGRFQMSTRLGGGGDDECSAVGMNSVIAAGSFQGSITVGNTTLVSTGTDSGFVVKYSVGAGVLQVAAGAQFGCALLAGGDVYCWGWNDGYFPADVPCGEVALPTKISGLPPISAITAGEYNECAIDDSGGVWCWGRGDSGQLGNGAQNGNGCGTTVPAPVQVVGLAGPAVEVAMTTYTSCARLASGQVQCWGVGSSGELGDGSMVDFNTQRLAPTTPVTGLDDAVGITAGGWYYFCAVRASGGVVCWGSTDWGELGTSSTLGTCPGGGCAPTPVAVDGLTDAVAVAAGEVHTCALRIDGSMVCWGGCFVGVTTDCAGADNLGILGTGSVTGSLTPVPVQGISDVTHMLIGSESSCAVVASGQAYCWGRNDQHELGIGDYSGQVIAPFTTHLSPVPVLGLDDARAVASGHYNSGEDNYCALRTSGGIATWGDDTFESSGNGSYGQDYTRPVAVVGLP